MPGHPTPAALPSAPYPPDAAERRLLERFNRTEADFPADLCLHELFAAQARRAPDAVALVFEDRPMTYAELDVRSSRLARHLVRLGVGPEVRVGICLHRGAELVVSMLGVLKAGGAYVPLDPANPAERLARMAADSGAAAVVTDEVLRGAFPLPPGVRVVSVDGDAARIAAERADAPQERAEPRNLAYVIYTSGSTGAPKGIAVPHRGVVNNLVDWTRRFGIGAADRALLVSALSFDVSVFETLGMLAVGAAVVIPGPDALRDPPRWTALMRRHGVTVWNSATALLGMLADHLDADPGAAPSSLRLTFTGGDWIPVPLPDRLRAHLPGVQVVSMGGVTEVSIYSVIGPVGRVDPAWPSIPWGVPMAKQRAYVLDEAMRPLPVEEAGEMYIGGVGVARGYVGRPGLTAERFLPDPFGQPGARMYRTGDRAHWRADGILVFLGRLDAQVKIRGNRVEPGEVEAVLRRHPGVDRCVVAGRHDARGETRLVAWIVGGADAADLREHARRELPDYMVPAAFVALDALPLSPNGKIDRRALPAPPDRAAERPFVAPATEVEQVLAELWSDVLRVDRVGADDDFFDLGGESALVTRLAAAVRAVLGVELSFRAVLAYPTLRGMAAEVEAALYEEIVAMSDAQAEQLAGLNQTVGGGP